MAAVFNARCLSAALQDPPAVAIAKCENLTAGGTCRVMSCHKVWDYLQYLKNPVREKESYYAKYASQSNLFRWDGLSRLLADLSLRYSVPGM